MSQASATSNALPKKKKILWRWVLVAGVIGVLAMIVKDPDAPSTQAPALSVEEMRSQSVRIPEQITYETLAREPAANKGKIVSFRGRVAQVVDSGNRVVLRIAVTEGRYGIWDDYIYIDHTKSDPNEPRILEKDIVDVLGEYVGIKTYTALMNREIQVPHVVARTVHRL